MGQSHLCTLPAEVALASAAGDGVGALAAHGAEVHAVVFVEVEDDAQAHERVLLVVRREHGLRHVEELQGKGAQRLVVREAVEHLEHQTPELSRVVLAERRRHLGQQKSLDPRGGGMRVVSEGYEGRGKGRTSEVNF